MFSAAGSKIVIIVFFFYIIHWLAFHPLGFPGQNIMEVNVSSAHTFLELLSLCLI